MSWFKKPNPVKDRWIAMYGSDYYDKHDRWYDEVCPILEKYLRTMVLATASQAIFTPKAEDLERVVGQIQKIIRPVWEPDDVLPNTSAVFNFHVNCESEALWQESYRLFSGFGPMLIRALVGYASICWLASWQPHILVNYLVAQILLDNTPMSYRILDDMIANGPDQLTDACLNSLGGHGSRMYQFYIVYILCAMARTDAWAKRKLESLPSSYMEDSSIASEVHLVLAYLNK